jgi:dipeptidyl aminopeptidase/acylaminoacyl peptidase
MPTYPVSRYLSIDELHAPAFAGDGEDLLCLADTTGTPQVWAVDGADAWPERLTAYEERVSTVAPSPERDEFAFAMDRGSDEYDQLYLYDREDGTVESLTAMPDAKHAWGGWDPDGEQFAFTSTRRTGSSFDAYVQHREGRGDDATLVHEGDERVTVLGWCPTGERIVVREDRSSAEQGLVVVDTVAGESVSLTADAEPASYGDVAFAGDEYLYCTTNRGADTMYLARLDVRDGSLDPVVEAGDWNVDWFEHDAETGNTVYARNVGGYTELVTGRIDGTEFEEFARPDVGDSVVQEADLGPDGERFALALSGDGEPYSLYVGDVASGEVEKWSGAGCLGVPESSFRESETVHYETFDGREIPAYWTLPEGAEPGSTPVMVDIHGGPEHQRRPWFYPEKQFFIDQGFAILEPNVRGSSGYGKEYAALDDVEKRMDSVKDIKHAVEWLADNEYADTDNVVVYGRSYGGFMVAAAITQYPDLWAAAVEFVGLVNFETFLENTSDWRRSHRAAEYGSLDDRELLREISPIHDMENVACPLMVLHGANDPRVPISESEQVLERAREAGVETESVFFDDEGHHFTKRENQIEAFEAVARFLREHAGAGDD